MKTYLVGGAVRDALLGLKDADRDWVVVGATAEQMLAQGFRAVGRDFPVFLHPETAEEYALARTERKSGPGYKGFVVHATPDVTLEQDLQRRDLTINAIAKDADGNLVDPWGGRKDLEQRVLRHVSPAFIEDPLRVLRVARFAARFAPQGFKLADETRELMQAMADSGELRALTPERVWQEVHTALQTPQPRVFFEVLRDCRALQHVLPEVDALFGIPQPEQWHPEIDTGLHTLMSLDQACAMTPDPATRFATLLHDVGKAATPREEWPKHIRHDTLGVKLVAQACDRLRVPREFVDLAKLTCRYHITCHRALELRPHTMLKLLEALDVFRRPSRLNNILIACEADARGRSGFENRDYPQRRLILAAAEQAQSVDAGAVIASRSMSSRTPDESPSGDQIRQWVRGARLRAVREAIDTFNAGNAGGKADKAERLS